MLLAKLKVSTDKSEPKLFITGYNLDDTLRDNLETSSVDISGVRLAEDEEKRVTVNFITVAEGITKINIQLISERLISKYLIYINVY